MKNLYLVRGLPGAGKTSFVSAMMSMIDTKFSVTNWEADDFFMEEDDNGLLVYRFRAELLRSAHYACQQMCASSMEAGVNAIFVSNTFTEEWEMQPYLYQAKEHGYRVTRLIVENGHEGESEHNVPRETVERMRARFAMKL